MENAPICPQKSDDDKKRDTKNPQSEGVSATLNLDWLDKNVR